MGQTRSRKYPRKQKTRRGGGLLNKGISQLATARPLAARFVSTAARPIYSTLYEKPDATVPMDALKVATIPQLRSIISGHRGAEPPLGSRKEKVLDAAITLLREKGMLSENTSSEPVEEAPTIAPANTDITFRSSNIPESTKEKVEVMHENTFGSNKTIYTLATELQWHERLALRGKKVFDNANIPAIQRTYRRFILAPVFDKFKISQTNRGMMKFGRNNVSNVNITNFEEQAIQMLDIILVHTTREEALKMAEVFTPNRMRRLKQALFNIFLISPNSAKQILDAFISDIVPRSALYSPGSIDSIITTMQTTPDEVIDKIKSESGYIAASQRDLANQTRIAEAKGMGWFRARAFYTLLLGGLGGVALFIMYWNGIYTGEELAFALRQKFGNTVSSIPVEDIMKESRVFYDALSLKMFEIHQQLTGTDVGQNITEKSRALAEKASIKYTEFTEPARPLTPIEQFSNYISNQYRYYFNPPEAPRPPQLR
jgi:hypothetical protein